MALDASKRTFPPFSLTRLLSTTFAPKPGERIAILIDLADPHQAKDFQFLKNPLLPIQRRAHDVFYRGLQRGSLAELGMKGGELYAYQITGGSNLDLPDLAVDTAGAERSLEQEIYPNYEIILCISTFSATAPLTAFAKRFGFRGATLHGVNDIILRTGLAVDYNDVSRDAEKLRLGLSGADRFEIDFEVADKATTLVLDCGRQEAQKSHGLCRGEQPDVANLPAGEVYFVPTGASGAFPMKYEDGTLGIARVAAGRIHTAEFLGGDPKTVEAHNQKLRSDPVTGELGELGFGTQVLPASGRDIQDEKIFGTFHVATGRSDHLGGKLTPDRFAVRENATHDDILFSQTKTPEIRVPQVRMIKGKESTVVIENYAPSAYLLGLLK